MSYYDLATYALYLAMAAAIACSVVAHANLHPDQKGLFRVFLWREKSEFSEKGWKFRQASACFGAIAFALIPLSMAVRFFENH